MTETETQRGEKIAMKINDILGDCNIVYLHYEFHENEQTVLIWKTEDGGEIFQHRYEFGWKQ